MQNIGNVLAGSIRELGADVLMLDVEGFTHRLPCNSTVRLFRAGEILPPCDASCSQVGDFAVALGRPALCGDVIG